MLQWLFLIRLTIKNRIENQFLRLFETFAIIKKWNRVRFFFFMKLLGAIPAIIVAFTSLKFLYRPELKNVWGACIFLGFLIFHAIQGLIVYRRTHFPTESNLYNVSPRSERFIYLMLLAEQWFWLICTYPSIYILAFSVYIGIHPELTLIGSIFVISTGFFLALICFIIFNLGYGLYMVHKVLKPIGIFRFAGYIITSSIFCALGYSIILVISPFIFIVREQFKSWDQVIDNRMWEELFPLVQDYVTLKMHWIFDFAFNESSFLVRFENEFYSGSMLYWIIIVCFGGFVLLFFKQLMPQYNFTESIIQRSFGRDFLVAYSKMLQKFREVLFPNDIFLWKDTQQLKESRWIISPQFFSLVFLSYESSFYFGIFLAAVNSVSNVGYIVTFIITFSLLTIVNQAYELREEFPILFLISSEGKQIELIRLSKTPILKLYLAKLKFMRLTMIIPMMIIIMMSLWMFQGLWSHLFTIFWVQCLAYWISPLCQLYISPQISKFKNQNKLDVGDTIEEVNIYRKFQAIPRKFAVVPLLIALYLLIFLHLPQEVINMLPYAFSIYFTLIVIVFGTIANSISKRGASKLEFERRL
ncbi:hypothetical protein P5G65_28135 [Paenibacillus chondroitinus]|uniref:ABC-2 type transport system permease protein n=1 Tax=Paenibacillus chondroitinus TaxID=59842 RepID=A0ABU6DJS9_9BACL|nr:MULTISPECIES: hypothetical protein [Paenibacillus]MCY9657574.1 hypothetical protein [Paenibacillus anseongense]MEB4797776.1 hypothetical protein [Paenibacillus chondroitinus]